MCSREQAESAVPGAGARPCSGTAGTGGHEAPCPRRSLPGHGPGVDTEGLQVCLVALVLSSAAGALVQAAHHPLLGHRA